MLAEKRRQARLQKEQEEQERLEKEEQDRYGGAQTFSDHVEAPSSWISGLPTAPVLSMDSRTSQAS